MFHKVRKIHMVGIGGTGMSGMAEILLHHGYEITGCDSNEQDVLNDLRSLGAEILIGHDDAHSIGCDVVVYSRALPDSQPGWTAARVRSRPAIKRAAVRGRNGRVRGGGSGAAPRGRGGGIHGRSSDPCRASGTRRGEAG